MAEEEGGRQRSSHIEERGPPCRRCGNTAWQVEMRPKHRFRFWLETLVAVPDVFIFRDESGGWPSPQAELWTCLACRRRIRR